MPERDVTVVYVLVAVSLHELVFQVRLSYRAV